MPAKGRPQLVLLASVFLGAILLESMRSENVTPKQAQGGSNAIYLAPDIFAEWLRYGQFEQSFRAWRLSICGA